MGISFGISLLVGIGAAVLNLSRVVPFASIVGWGIWAAYYNAIHEQVLLEKGYGLLSQVD